MKRIIYLLLILNLGLLSCVDDASVPFLVYAYNEDTGRNNGSTGTKTGKERRKRDDGNY